MITRSVISLHAKALTCLECQSPLLNRPCNKDSEHDWSTMFLDMYEQPFAKLVGGVMATGPHSELYVEILSVISL